MSVQLDVPRDVKQAFERARVMAGSSLTPASRHAQDTRAHARDVTDWCVEQHEEKRAAATDPDDTRPRDEWEAQMGRILSGVQVEEKLRKLNPSLHFEDSLAFPERRLIYKGTGEGRKLVAAMERGPMPEFSVIDAPKEKWLTPSEAKRGWRTVLGHCIRHRVINPESAIREFGIPTHDSAQWSKILL